MKITIHADNWEKGRAGFKIEAVVLHVMQGTLAGTDDWFQHSPEYIDPVTKKPAPVYGSSNAGIGKKGEVHDYVDKEDTAYHAGRVSQPVWSKIKKNWWGGFVNPNSYTYGLECEGVRGDTWTEPQMIEVVKRTKEILDFAGLPADRSTVISHNETAIDKEDMRLWCDEVIRRIKAPVVVTPDKAKAIKMIEDGIAMLKQIP